jgi:hypothetical protein
VGGRSGVVRLGALVGPDDAVDVVADAFTPLLERPDGPWASMVIRAATCSPSR